MIMIDYISQNFFLNHCQLGLYNTRWYAYSLGGYPFADRWDAPNECPRYDPKLHLLVKL